MIIDCISDLHGQFPTLEGGDLLIIAGDLTARDTHEQHIDFCEWLDVQTYTKKIVIAGNHDNNINKDSINCLRGCTYLEDSGTEYEGLKIWGSPWTAQFPGINPNCCAFSIWLGSDTDNWLKRCWDLIPSDTDILITHSPPFGIYDKTSRGDLVGSPSLLVKVAEMKPLIHCFGHIHEDGGKETFLPWGKGTNFVNASLVNEFYQPLNQPVRIVL